MYQSRYIFDALYGAISLPEYVWQVLSAPELQRLREVRLCNINSLCLTGGANINRYEHSIGCAYLATRCMDRWPIAIPDETRKKVILAALLHDVGTAPFGHSVQYVLDPAGYQHESLYDILSSSGNNDPGRYRYQHARMEPLYFGIPKRLPDLIPTDELKEISEMVSGGGEFGKLISGTVDLDNVDNVFRLAYHIGLIRDGRIPLSLAEGFTVANRQLVIDDSATLDLEAWYDVRRRLYEYLLLNPDEFAAKCMLQEAVELAMARNRSDVSFKWHDVDFELVSKLAACSSEVSQIVSRLMVGDLYGCIGIFSSSNVAAYDTFNNPHARTSMEKELTALLRRLGVPSLKSAVIALHAIKDVNKTQRQINVQTISGKIVSIGTPTRRLLVGIFLKNVHFGMTAIRESLLQGRGVRSAAREWMKGTLNDEDLTELVPYAEAGAAG